MKKQDIPILKIEDSDKKLEDYELEEIREIDEHLKKYSHDHKMYVRCLAVKMVILGETRKKVGEFLNVDRQTVGRWYKQYNEHGFEGLEPDYSNCGVKCRLTDEQIEEIRQRTTNPEEHYDIKRTRKLINDKYGIKYTYKQVWIISRDKLNLNYRKPYLKYNESPEDAEEQFKKNFENRP